MPHDQWPMNSAHAVSYSWSMMTMRLSCTVIEIRGLKKFGLWVWAFGVTWRHRLGLRDWWICLPRIYCIIEPNPTISMLGCWSVSVWRCGKMDDVRTRDVAQRYPVKVLLNSNRVFTQSSKRPANFQQMYSKYSWIAGRLLDRVNTP